MRDLNAGGARIVPYSGPRPPSASTALRPSPAERTDWSATRRRFLASFGAAAIGVGLASLGVFPPAREALAHRRNINPSCLAVNENDQCNPGCGPSDVCSHCCASGWHRETGNYMLRPHECPPGQHYDGWLWSYSNDCACCAAITWRCHDGEYNTGSGWVDTICRHKYGCTCPCCG